MTSSRQFTISELVEQTGVPATSIHHYVHLGLLPAPERAASNRFLYDERHVHAVRLVRLLREQHQLSLETVAEILPELLARTDDAVRPGTLERLIAEHDPAHGARVALLDAARKQFGMRGYGDVNVAELCEAAGIAKGSFYRHFSSKDELFVAAVASATADVRAGFRDRVARLQRIGAGHLDQHGMAVTLGELLAAELPLLLELVTRALQHQPEHARAARDLFDELVDEVRAELKVTAGREAAGRVAWDAIAHALTLTLRLGRH